VNFTYLEWTLMASAITAVLMVGSLHLKANLFYYCVETLLIAAATAITGYLHHEPGLYVLAAAIAILKSISIPVFLNWCVDKLDIHSDKGAILPAPLAMHLNIMLLALGYFLVSGLPIPLGDTRAWPGAMSAISLLLSGLVLMLTRKIAIGQIIGFLVLENGIFLFALTQTRGMPLIVEMGIMLDVLVGVMIAGLLVFNIKSSFEHIDVSQLTELRD